jgi:hypothetical protein
MVGSSIACNVLAIIGVSVVAAMLSFGVEKIKTLILACLFRRKWLKMVFDIRVYGELIKNRKNCRPCAGRSLIFLLLIFHAKLDPCLRRGDSGG